MATKKLRDYHFTGPNMVLIGSYGNLGFELQEYLRSLLDLWLAQEEIKRENADDKLGLFIDLWEKKTPLLEKARTVAGDAQIWAAAILAFAGRDHEAVFTAYDQLIFGIFAEHNAEMGVTTEVLLKLTKVNKVTQAKLAKLGRRAAGDRDLLIAKTDAAIAKNPKLTREHLAEKFSKDPAINLKKTQIKKHYREWYSRLGWPKSAGGRKPTRRNT